MYNFSCQLKRLSLRVLAAKKPIDQIKELENQLEIVLQYATTRSITREFFPGFISFMKLNLFLMPKGYLK